MPIDKPVPPAGEEIHLPGGSLQPLLVAVGTTIALIGVTTSIVLVIAGGLLTLVTIIRWVTDARRDMEALPVHHGDDQH
jgi:hypothetical protein